MGVGEGEQEGCSALQAPSRKHLAQLLFEARELLPSPLQHATLDSQAMHRLGFPRFPPSLLVTQSFFSDPLLSAAVLCLGGARAFLLVRAC